MDIKLTRPSLTEEANAALTSKGGYAGLPSLPNQLIFRTMKEDLAALGKDIDLKEMAKEPFLEKKPAQIPTPPPPPPAAPAPAPKPVVDEKVLLKERAQTAEEQAVKAKAEQKAAALKQKQEQVAAKKAAEQTAKEQTLAEKQKIAQAKAAHQRELKASLEQAVLSLKAREFNATIANSQKIINDSTSNWLVKWRAKRLVSQAQAGLRQADIDRLRVATKPEIKPIIKPEPVIAPVKPLIPPTSIATPAKPLLATSAPPINLPTVAPAPTPAPQAPPIKPPEPIQPIAPAAPKPILPEPPVKPFIPPTPAPAPPIKTEIAPPPPKPIIPPSVTPPPLVRKPEPKKFEPTEEPINFKKVLLVALPTLLVLVLISWGLWWFWTPSQEPVASLSPSPSLSASPSQSAPATPPALFKMDEQKIFELPAGQEKTFVQQALPGLAQSEAAAGNFTYLLFKNSLGGFLSLDETLGYLSSDLLDLPTQKCVAPEQCAGLATLKSQLDLDTFSFFVYSQSSPNASPFTASANFGRLGLIVSLKNSTSTSQLAQSLRDLEALMPQSLKALLFEAKNQIPGVPAFNEAIYKGVTIRYINLPGPNLSLDYAILNKQLLIATSKESMLAAIDRLLPKTGASLNPVSSND